MEGAKKAGFGEALMMKQGWAGGGTGIGRDGKGVADHVKVSKKDDVKGIGYSAKLNQTYSAQSVAFEDVLSRVSGSAASPAPEGSPAGSPTSGAAVSAGKHAVAYAKRRALKTGALTSADGKAELLGAGKKYRAEREADQESDAENEADVSTLQSPILRRLTVRCVALEPKATSVQATVTVTKPEPKPPKVTDTPFLA